MSSTTLKADLREKMGSRATRELRASGMIPATIQGGGGDHLNVSLDAHEFWNARRRHVHLFDVELAGGSESVTVRELQWSSLGDEVAHIEFRRVQRGVKTEVEVDLEFVGHPAGGVINHLVNAVMVRCLPTLIPDSIEVRVEGLAMGHSVRAKDIVLPEGLELLTPPETPVAVVAGTRGLDEIKPVEEGTGSGAAPAAGDEAKSEPS